MGLLDALAGQAASALGGGAAQGNPLLEVVAGLINNPQTGGLAGLVNAFQQKGLGDVVGSWVSTGQNLPISADQLGQVLGNGQIAAMAQQLGFSPQDMSGQLAQMLPQVIDRLTPNGALPQGDIGSAIGMLGSLFK